MELKVTVPVASATVRIVSLDGYVYEAEFYTEDDWPLEAAFGIGQEEIDVTPPGGEWLEVEGGRKFADLHLSGLARVARLGP